MRKIAIAGLRQTFPDCIFGGALLVALLAPGSSGWAGPPYFTDDPGLPDSGEFEIYVFSTGAAGREGHSGVAGIDFNYGITNDLQATAVVPVGYDSPAGARSTIGFGNIELAAKYRFVHQAEFGWDVSVTPRVFLPSGSPVGVRHASFLLPIWVGKNWEKWSAFGGGGCEINRGQGSRDFCLMGWALTRQVLPNLRLGAEIYHQTATTYAGRATTALGAGLQFDLNDHRHLLASIGPGIQNATQTNQFVWYFATLFTF